jgi:hypothetical protein
MGRSNLPTMLQAPIRDGHDLHSRSLWTISRYQVTVGYGAANNERARRLKLFATSLHGRVAIGGGGERCADWDGERRALVSLRLVVRANLLVFLAKDQGVRRQVMERQ